MYKRTKSGSPLRCPYCGKQFRMNMERQLSYMHSPPFRFNMTACRKCGRTFFYRNISAQYAREHGIRATFRLDELNESKNERMK